MVVVSCKTILALLLNSECVAGLTANLRGKSSKERKKQTNNQINSRTRQNPSCWSFAGWNVRQKHGTTNGTSRTSCTIGQCAYWKNTMKGKCLHNSPQKAEIYIIHFRFVFWIQVDLTILQELSIIFILWFIDKTSPTLYIYTAFVRAGHTHQSVFRTVFTNPSWTSNSSSQRLQVCLFTGSGDACSCQTTVGQSYTIMKQGITLPSYFWPSCRWLCNALSGCWVFPQLGSMSQSLRSTRSNPPIPNVEVFCATETIIQMIQLTTWHVYRHNVFYIYI